MTKSLSNNASDTDVAGEEIDVYGGDAEDRAILSGGPLSEREQDNSIFGLIAGEYSRRAALSSYTDSRSNSVVSRIAQLEVEGLRRREKVVIDEQALKRYAYQENDPFFREATFERLNRYISANHNDIYVKALRNKASSTVGERGQDISYRLQSTRANQGTGFTGQSSSNLGSIRHGVSRDAVADYRESGGTSVTDVLSSVRSAGVLSTYGSAPLSVDHSKILDAAKKAGAGLKSVMSGAVIRKRDGDKDKTQEGVKDPLSGLKKGQSEMNVLYEEHKSRVLINNTNTCITSNPDGSGEYESAATLSGQKVESKPQVEPRTVIQVRESDTGEFAESYEVFDPEEDLAVTSGEDPTDPGAKTESAAETDAAEGAVFAADDGSEDADAAGDAEADADGAAEAGADAGAADVESSERSVAEGVTRGETAQAARRVSRTTIKVAGRRTEQAQPAATLRRRVAVRRRRT